MSVCRICGVELTDENWKLWERKKKHHRCRDCSTKFEKEYYHAHRSHMLKIIKDQRQRVKLEVFSYYSGSNPPFCANPFQEHKKPYTTIEALTIDHINDDGAKQRKRLFGKNECAGYQFYQWLKRNNYPKEYQVLCFNCQWIKRIRGLNTFK